jgi:hypothetical protein
MRKLLSAMAERHIPQARQSIDEFPTVRAAQFRSLP